MAMEVDFEWASGIFEWWIGTARSALAKSDSTYTFCSRSAATEALQEKEDQVARAVQAVLGRAQRPKLVRPTPGGHNFVELQEGIDLVQYALGKLRTEEETRKHIRGTMAPTMSADALHEIVWNSARDEWNSGHYTQAVQRAATFLSAHVQSKIGRTDIADRELMTQAFSAAPAEPNRPRLRWPGNDEDLSVKAMRVGILNFGQGVYSAIRNPATHGTEEMPRQVALEQLATLSTLARWIDNCDVIVANDRA